MVLWLRRFAKVGPKSEVVRRIGCPRCRQNLHHACAPERFGSQNRSKLAVSEHFSKLSSTKFAPRLRVRAIRKSKSSKTGRLGALLEVELRKICTTPARENDLEVKIVKAPGARDVFGGAKRFSPGRRRDFETLQNTWQAQEFVRVAKTLAGVGDLKRVWNDAFRVAGAVISRFVMSMFEASDAETVEGLQISVIISRGSYRTSYASAQLFRGRRSTLEASFEKSLKHIGILRSSVRSICHFWRKSRKKSFVFDFQRFIFEGSLAELLRFWALTLQFWRKSRKKASFLIFKASFLKEVSHKSSVCLGEQLRLTKPFESHISWPPNHLNLTPFDIQITWISNQLTITSFEVQINRQPKSFEAHIDRQPNHLNLKSIDNQISWISNQLTTKIIWISNQMTTKSFDFQLVWIWHQLTFEPIELRTLPSYRFLIFGSFRHRLVR